MVIVLLAEGFEEIEALTPVDILRRRGVNVKTVGMTGELVYGSHGIGVLADLTVDEVKLEDIEMTILPGGMPGTLNLDKNSYTDTYIKAAIENGGRVAAICAAPLVLGRRGLLKGKKATCFPGFEGELVGAEVVKESVVTDGIFTTACGMEAALAFAKEIERLIVK